MMTGIDNSFDGVMFVGYHTKLVAGVPWITLTPHPPFTAFSLTAKRWANPP